MVVQSLELVVAPACNPSAGDVEEADSWGLLAIQPSLVGEFQTSERLFLKSIG